MVMVKELMMTLTVRYDDDDIDCNDGDAPDNDTDNEKDNNVIIRDDISLKILVKAMKCTSN